MNWPSNFTIITDEISQELTDVARFVRAFKLSGIELRSMFGRAFKDLTNEDIAKIKEQAKADGWKVYGVSSPVFKCEIDDEKGIRDHVEIFKRSLETAVTLNSDLIRVFTFLRRPTAPDAATVERIAGHLAKLAELAAGSGVRVGVENESSCIIGSDAELTALAPHLKAKNLGLIWDPCNVLYVPGASGGPSTKTFENLLPQIFHVHVKDAARLPKPAAGSSGLEGMPVGLGDVNWHAHFASIQRSGYRGMLSLETHWRRERIDEKLLHLPAGHAFSRGGEEASTTCLHNIQALCTLL